MTTYPTLKIVYGNRSIDLNDWVNFYVRTDLVPPETNLTAQIATGSALNVAGGRMVARKPQTRAWSFSVRAVGTTDAEIVNQLRGVKALLALAGDANEPVKIVYSPNSDTPEPVWGQFGTLLNYEVLDGSITIGPDYMRGARRAKAVVATFNLTIQPYATGKQQRVCSALGGVLEDKLGTVDGLSRGMGVPEATTNLCINPIFGNATYDTGWTTGANLVAAKNTDARYVALGFASALLTALEATNNTFTQSITLAASTHALSVMVKQPDSAAVTNADMQITYNGTDRTTTFTAIGDGWYMAEASVTGTGGAAACGVTVKILRTIYLGAMQVEAKAYRTPMCHGDMLGCAWSATAHASTSARTAARMRISTAADTVRTGPFAARLVWTAGAAVSNNMTLLDMRDGTYTTGPQIYISGAKFNCIYSGFNIGHATAIAANTAYVIHLVFDGSTFELYVNGVASGNASTPTTLGALGPYAFIGTDYSTANHCNGLFGGVAFWNVALSATQVANDYANAAAVVADGARVESVPWLWTKDGDNVVDNCNDSTRDNWCVVGGVGGTSPARTVISMQLSDYLSSVGPIALSLLDVREFSNTVNAALMADSDGTVDAGSCGGSYEALSVSTTDTTPDDLIRAYFKDLAGKTFVLVARIKNAGSGLLMKGDLAIANMVTATAWKSIPNNAAYRLFYTDELRVPDNTPVQSGLSNATKRMTIDVAFKRATGTANIDIDFTHLLVRPLALISYINPTTTAGVMLVGNRVYTLDEPVIGTASSPSDFYEYGKLTGDAIEFVPERMNVLTSFIGLMNASSNPALDSAIYYQRVMIEPRYNLL